MAEITPSQWQALEILGRRGTDSGAMRALMDVLAHPVEVVQLVDDEEATTHVVGYPTETTRCGRTPTTFGDQTFRADRITCEACRRALRSAGILVTRERGF